MLFLASNYYCILNRERYIYKIFLAGLVFLSIFYSAKIHAQDTVLSDSIINVYRKVVSVHSFSSFDKDSVFVADASVFNKKEIALFIVTQGANIRSEGIGKGDIADMNNTGKYLLIYIDTVEYDKNLVIFNSTMSGVKSLKPGERAQLVTVPRYKNLTVTNKLTCQAWDSVSGTGGVLAFIVLNLLDLQADIDVTGKGFKGASPGNELYAGSCSFQDAGYFNDFFTYAAKDSGALRGEGISLANFKYPRGRLAVANSGSGGSGKFSGGGGGSNGGSGGIGGRESRLCSPSGDIGGFGGTSLAALFYSNTDPLYANRIYMGGGGGTGTQDIPSGKAATRGGNGGGIIVFTANKVKANGFSIKSNGETVTSLAGAGAGGGGGAGVIVADVLEYTDALTVEIKGGSGGNVLAAVDTTGPGGGGGGGVYWFNQSTFIPANVTSLRIFGSAGTVIGGSSYGATSGSQGSNISNLVIPRRGFLENKIPDDQVICEGDVPNVLNAPAAKGGNNGPFTYKWIQSKISVNGPWLPATGIINQQNYTPPVLTDTTFYSRVISDGSLVDTSFAVMIAVHPALQNNGLLAIDTICSQLSPGQLNFPSGMTGGLGNGTYAYSWEQSPDNSVWLPAGGVSNSNNYEVPVLNESIYYRRKVSSGACVDASNSFRIQVLPLLTSNDISDNQIICFGQQPAVLTGSIPVGGLAGDRRYSWESTDDLVTWSSMATSPAYTPGILTDTAFYRRIVYSGPGNTCKSISNTLKITVLPAILNNQVNHQDTVLCAGLPGLSLTGSQPSGGDGLYKYLWEKRIYNSSSWVLVRENNNLQPYETGTLNDSTWFRRIIKSGTGDVCINPGDSFLISVLPPVVNNSISASQLICENIPPAPLTGTNPMGGNGSFLFEWQKSPDGSSNWEKIIPDEENAGYSPPPAGATTYFRRVVYSGPGKTCTNSSGNVKIEVQPAIANNTIVSGDLVYTCFNTQPEIVQGSNNLTGGDGSSYVFKWEESNDLSAWGPASQSNTQKDYQPQVLVDSIYLRRLITSGECSDTTPVIKIQINPLPELNSLVKTFPDASICDDQILFLKVNIDKGKSPYNILYTNAIDPVSLPILISTDTSSFNVDVVGAAPNSYSFRITELSDANGCKATTANLGLYSANIDVYRAARPAIGMSDVEEICGNTITLMATPDVGGGIWKTMDPVIVFSTPLTAQTQASFSLQGFNSHTTKFYYAESTPGCGEKSDSITVIFYEQPDEAVINNDTTGQIPFILFLSDNILLKSNTPSAGTGSWTLDSGPGSIESQGNNFAQLTGLVMDQQTRVNYTIINGVCDAKTSFIVIERKDVKIYEGFSPNGDQVNDYLYAEGVDRSGDDLRYSLSIFNSSGVFVRELNNEAQLETSENNAVWDGISQNGKLAADGTYYYVMKINYKGSEYTYKGFFVLKTE